jgi:hypothetical protein
VTPDPMTLDDLIDAQEAHDEHRLHRWGITTAGTSKTEDSAPRQERGQDDEDHDEGGSQ